MTDAADRADAIEGSIRFFHRRRGFGFIAAEGHEDVFVHHSQLRNGDGRSLSEGDVVRFRIGDGPKGPQAVDVELVGGRVPEPVG